MKPADIAAEILGTRAQRRVSLGPFCTYRVGGPAKLFVTVESVSDLQAVAEAVDASGLPTLVIGKGSNLLVADAGFPGIAVRLGDAFATIEVNNDPASPEGPHVVAGGAALLPVLARRTVAEGFDNLVWAVGVPGSVGGAVRMNAGGHGRDIQADLRSAALFDLATGVCRRVESADLAFGYRRSAVGPTEVVTTATFALVNSGADGAALLSEVVAWRRENQPGGANAGSVFANPEGDSAGRLIDSAGLKGYRIGSAMVSTKHANFIQVDANGSADDVARLIRHLRSTIRDDLGVELRPENRLVGFDEEAT